MDDWYYIRAVITVGSTPTVLAPSDCSAVLGEIRPRVDKAAHNKCSPFLPGRNVFQSLLEEFPIRI